MSFMALGAAGGVATGGALALGPAGTAALGLGGGALGGLLGGGLGGSSGGKQRVSLANPAGKVLGDLFGTRFTRKGGFIRQGDPNAPFASGNILPAIESYVYNPLVGTPQDLSSFRGLMQERPMVDIIRRGMEGFSGLSDLGLLGAATGFETNADPIYQEAIRRFKTDVLPQVAETSGLGLRSSGFEAMAGREAANLMGQAALRQTELSEAAAQRRMGLLPIAGQLQAAEAAFPLNIAADIEAGSARPLTTFMGLAGLGNNMPFIQQGFPTTDRTSDMLSSLGGLASLMGVLGSGGGGG